MTLILAGELSWVGFPKVVQWDPFDLREQCALTGEARNLAGDTCLICCGDDQSSVSQILGEDLCQLHLWVEESHMSFNVQKSNVMWFNIRSQRSFEAPVLLDGSPLTKVDTSIWVL